MPTIPLYEMICIGATSNEVLDMSNFHLEIERLKSFEGWRVPFLSASQMTEAGFYYTKKDDIVRCAFCGVEVGSWVEGDNPMVDHKRWSPACRFLRNLPVGNVPLVVGDLTSVENVIRQYGIVLSQPQSATISEASTSGGESQLENVQNIEMMGIQQVRPPTFPIYTTFKLRLNSYDMWPISLKVRPEMLSAAGFFYTGKGDQTICYYCGGGLMGWEDSDVPWEEHAKWFNRCYYVLSIKGKEFVDKVCNREPQQDETGIRIGESVSESSLESTKPRNENEPSTSSTYTLSSSSEQTIKISTGVNVTSISTTNSVDIVTSPTTDSRLCKICYMDEMSILFLPCAHIVACSKCALSLTKCVLCRKSYTATIRVFLS